MDTSTDKLRETVLRVVKAGALRKSIRDVKIEPDVDEEGNEFLRVLVELTSAEADDEQLEAILEKIEAAVLDVDSRYPSVRFLDAA